MRYYERRLPHWDVIGIPLFVTFRLFGSLPRQRPFASGSIPSGQAFVALDRLLDQARRGPAFLRHPEIAQIVAEALHDGEIKFRRYTLHAFAIMPNHVHVLVTPSIATARWLGPLKGYTAYRANQILGRPGQTFWQDERYDRLIRNQREFDRIRSYIEDNPVNAGLALSPDKYPWCSAGWIGV